MPAVGEKAPDFELLNQDGKKVRLSDFRGHKVIIFVYPAAFTEGCTKQACGFRDHFPQIKVSNAVVLGLSPDTVEQLAAWKKAENLPYDLLSDPDHKVMEAWGAWGEKTSYGKTYVGVIRSHFVIDENGNFIDVHIGVKPLDSVELATKAVGA
jgi:thioredoxin-dependent peroxiredoxin